MLQKKNDHFLTECRLFHFSGCCEHCVHFDGGPKTCSFYWPNEAHRLASVVDATVSELSFCKDFELN
ncbi:MAG: hypothetical protein CVU59_03990 [Deltaproteobacteria bacterium HGW-Deltaproteobacteria-17]|jgi:hypothetical protein|nr:MAG: hypothetical protein CVU59_03990 [Deltaproteobacteria bacterium HGW-Deltaproteobacteria-17]